MTQESIDISSFLEKLAAPNIAVIGLAGVGKSSLINAVFGMDIAPTGAGISITPGFVKYPPQNEEMKVPVTVYDSSGYEPGKDTEMFFQTISNFIREKTKKGKEEQIHLIWYVISAPSARLTDFDIKIINEIRKNHIPIIIVLSQCDHASPDQISELKLVIEKFISDQYYKIIEVAASPLEIAGKRICEPFGIKRLVQETVNRLPEIYSEAILVAQIADIESKREFAWNHIREAAIGCFAIATIPLPLTAPASAVASLGYMYQKIAIMYGHNNINILLGASGMTLGGIITVLVDGFLDFYSWAFPGISLFTGATAAAFTISSGIAFTKTCEKLALGEISGSQNEIKSTLRETFAAEFRKLQNLRVSKLDDLTSIHQSFIQGTI